MNAVFDTIAGKLRAVATALCLALALGGVPNIAAADPVGQPAAADQTPATDQASVANPYGIDALWKGGDFVSRSVLVLMLLMSGGTWYVMITKLIDQSKMLRQGRQANDRFWRAGGVDEALKKLGEDTPFWYIAERGIAASEHHQENLTAEIDRSTWIIMSINRAVEDIQNRLQDGLSILATVGSTAPFVGLFGTVWGIYHALTAIGIAGQASIDKVAGPVGEALIMTAVGLAVAVPAVLGYNLLVRRNKAGMERVRAFSADLHSVLLAGSRVGEQRQMAEAA